MSETAAPPPRRPNVRIEGGRLVAIKCLLWIALLAPFAHLAWGAVSGGLGPNPQETVQRSTGWWALAILCLTLAITPLRHLTGWPWWLRLRRPIGLFAFFYATVHLLTWTALDQRWVVADLWHDFVKRPFITAGVFAWATLLVLAATSPRFMSRRLGGRRWQAIHRAVYAAAVLGVLHYWWMRAAKNDLAEVKIFAWVVAALLLVRAARAVTARVARAR